MSCGKVEWSKAVRDRDGKCQECGKTTDLHAHHIKPKSTHPELALVLENGKTLLKRIADLEKEVAILRTQAGKH